MNLTRKAYAMLERLTEPEFPDDFNPEIFVSTEVLGAAANRLGLVVHFDDEGDLVISLANAKPDAGRNQGLKICGAPRLVALPVLSKDCLAIESFWTLLGRSDPDLPSNDPACVVGVIDQVGQQVLDVLIPHFVELFSLKTLRVELPEKLRLMEDGMRYGLATE